MGVALWVDGFRRDGFAVRDHVFSERECQLVREAFAAELKPYQGPLLRQASAREEPHRTSASGLVVNALLDIHDLPVERFPAFVRAALAVVTHERLVGLLSQLLGAPPVLVETMYFESSLGNGVHADGHYMDAVAPGVMVGAWIALEDIEQEAGRFFVYPRTHVLGTDIAALREVRADYLRYEEMVTALGDSFLEADQVRNAMQRAIARRLVDRILKTARLAPSVPALRAGDVVFWTSRTLHGSYPPARPDRSRHSLTAHYIREGDGYSVYKRPRQLRLRRINGVQAHCRQDEVS